ncbi:hypothetical protein [Microvirga arsenatis]|uniref:Secreted protein n=1 Tax=Microvirga arsenatis TaxID=2692265 RepID=A0ABW9Z0T5_9HYPH|nr:hypothetical protein [Microvirga arsenatis]NBJ12254.1 hypothetical protein [Microvirga arsenatis]NBJ26045.1 hypothetical protein [Microvirga arsenatis]
MRRMVLALAVMASASAAHAQPRPMTPAMSCDQARGLVFSRGAVVLGTGAYTYDRYVRGRGFCEINEVTEPAFVPTRDTPQCPVGYRCRDLDLFFND